MYKGEKTNYGRKTIVRKIHLKFKSGSELAISMVISDLLHGNKQKFWENVNFERTDLN